MHSNQQFSQKAYTYWFVDSNSHNIAHNTELEEKAQFDSTFFC
jgi:hypothetical protein